MKLALAALLVLLTAGCAALEASYYYLQCGTGTECKRTAAPEQEIQQAAFAGEPRLKYPPAIIVPAPEKIQPAEPEFYILPASSLHRVSEVIENMLREIQRLEAIVANGSCT